MNRRKAESASRVSNASRASNTIDCAGYADDGFDALQRVLAPKYAQMLGLLSKRFDDGQIAANVGRLTADELRLKPLQHCSILDHCLSIAETKPESRLPEAVDRRPCSTAPPIGNPRSHER